ncbi:MAG TPA: hypothetical protein VEB21_05355 [Terriglobales bacterium]|nr:hypothetical protein [Terriglobales bacterium]
MTAQQEPKDRPLYPLDQSFVVQIERSWEAGGQTLSGRIEHVASGEALDFADDQALLRFIDDVLRSARRCP